MARGVVVVLVAGLAVGTAVAADWPQFRGAGRDGVAAEKGLARSWPASGPKVVWKQSIGDGFSGVVVLGDRVYTLTSDATHELAAAYDKATGKELWKVPIGDRFTDEFGDGPRSTPAVEGDRVYVLGSKGKLAALESASGKLVWEVDLPQRFGAALPRWGFSTSPLLDAGQLVLEVGGGEGKRVAALDVKNGETRWTALDGGSGYSSPIVVTIDGLKQYVLVAGKKIVGLDPQGKLLWSFDFEPGAIATPLFAAPDRIFVSSSDDLGSVLVRVRREGEGFKAESVWTSRLMKNSFNASVLVGERIFGFDNATLRCLALDTGDSCWAQRGYGKGSLIAADGLLIALGDQGQLLLLDAGAKAYAEKGNHKVFPDKSWTSPTLAGGRLYLRSQRELVCLDLRG